MDNINIEEYIKDLSPELQEKAKACTSIEELLKLARENKVPLPDEALEIVAGGKSGSEQKSRNVKGKKPIDFPCFCLLAKEITTDYERFPYAVVCNIVFVTRQNNYLYVFQNEYCSGPGIKTDDASTLIFYADKI